MRKTVPAFTGVYGCGVIGYTFAMHTESDRLNTLLETYLAADYRWHHEGQWRPLVIGHAAPVLDDAFPAAAQFGLLTAWNPQSVPQPEQRNRDADHALHEALEGSGLAYTPAFAAARNRTWKEASWLVIDMPPADLDRLAHRFGQLATLCWRRGEAVRLRMLAARTADGAHEFVDWIT